jgi:hypothetical protein
VEHGSAFQSKRYGRSLGHEELPFPGLVRIGGTRKTGFDLNRTKGRAGLALRLAQVVCGGLAVVSAFILGAS